MNDGFFKDDAEEYLKNNKTHKNEKTDVELLEEKIYERRCKLVKLAHSDYHKFISYLLEYEVFFKTKMKPADKECMRRTCQTAFNNYNGAEYNDIEIFDRIFGIWIDPRKSKTIPVSCGTQVKETVKSVEDEIKERSCGSYYAMWDFITNPVWQEKLKGRADLYDKVKFMIDRAKENNDAVTDNFKRYEPSDEEMYVKVLELMKK